jgi:replication factor A2
MNFESNIPASPSLAVAGTTMRAFTVKQANAVEADEFTTTEFRYKGASVTKMVLLGWIREARPSSAGVVFLIEDGTGSIECSCWSNTEMESQTATIKNGVLARAIGTMKVFGGKKSVGVAYIEGVKDGNHLIYHFLCAIHADLYHQGKIAGMAERENSFANTSVVHEQRRMDEETLTRIQLDAIRCYRNNQGEQGLPADVVCGMLRERYSEGEVRTAIDWLIENSYLYYMSNTELRTTED